MKKFDRSQSSPCLRVLKERIMQNKYITGVWLSSVFLFPPDPWPVIMDRYTAPKVSSQMVLWSAIASIYWCN